MAQLQATTIAGVLTDLRTENTTTVSRSLTLDDRNKVVACTNTSNITITVPNDTTTLFPIGSVVFIARISTGAVTLDAAAGVTLTKAGSIGTGEELYCRKRAANTWVVVDQPGSPTFTGGTQNIDGAFTVIRFQTTGTSVLSIS